MTLGAIKSHDGNRWNATALGMFNKKDIEYIGHKLEIDIYNVDKLEVVDILIELSNRHILPKPCERDWYHVSMLENFGYKFPKDILLIKVSEIKSLNKDMLQIEVQLKKLNQDDEKYQQYYITIPKQLTEAIGMEPDDGLSVCIDGGDIVFRREGRASIQQMGRVYHLPKKDEDSIIRLLTGTPLKCFPKKDVIDTIYKGKLKPSEIIGHMENINTIIAYMIVHKIEPISPECRENSDVKYVYDLSEWMLNEVVKNNFGVCKNEGSICRGNL